MCLLKQVGMYNNITVATDKRSINLAYQVNPEFKPFPSKLNDYDRIKICFDYQSIAYTPQKNKMEGDFVFRFPEHTFILRTKGNSAYVLVDEAPKNILLDFSFKDTQTYLKIIKRKINLLLLPFNKNFKINTKPNIKYFYNLLYYIKSFTKSPRRDYEKRNLKMVKNKKKIKIKNVLILQGSPRLKQGYTQIYLNYLLEGLKMHPVDIEIIYVYEKHIEYCRGCFSCWFKNNGKCIIRDDMDEILYKMENTELILLALPIYTCGVPAKLKTVFDRLINFVYPYMIPSPDKKLSGHPKHNLKNQFLAGLTIGGFPDEEHFIPITTYLDRLAKVMSVDFLGNITIPYAVGLDLDPLETYILKTAGYLKKIGFELLENNTLNRKLLKKIKRNKTWNIKKCRLYANMHYDYLIMKAQNKI
jgi:multimeric flavodoxin WrbA